MKKLFILGMLLAVRAFGINTTSTFWDVTVASNLTARSITLGGDKRTNWPSGGGAVSNLASVLAAGPNPGSAGNQTITGLADAVSAQDAVNLETLTAVGLTNGALVLVSGTTTTVVRNATLYDFGGPFANSNLTFSFVTRGDDLQGVLGSGPVLVKQINGVSVGISSATSNGSFLVKTSLGVVGTNDIFVTGRMLNATNALLRTGSQAVTNGLLIASDTNGYVNASITNGLLIASDTNGYVKAAITNGLATLTYVNGMTNTFYPITGNPSGFLTSIPSQYMTNGGFLIQVVGGPTNTVQNGGSITIPAQSVSLSGYMTGAQSSNSFVLSGVSNLFTTFSGNYMTVTDNVGTVFTLMNTNQINSISNTLATATATAQTTANSASLSASTANTTANGAVTNGTSWLVPGNNITINGGSSPVAIRSGSSNTIASTASGGSGYTTAVNSNATFGVYSNSTQLILGTNLPPTSAGNVTHVNTNWTAGVVYTNSGSCAKVSAAVVQSVTVSGKSMQLVVQTIGSSIIYSNAPVVTGALGAGFTQTTPISALVGTNDTFTFIDDGAAASTLANGLYEPGICGSAGSNGTNSTASTTVIVVPKPLYIVGDSTASGFGTGSQSSNWFNMVARQWNFANPTVAASSGVCWADMTPSFNHQYLDSNTTVITDLGQNDSTKYSNAVNLATYDLIVNGALWKLLMTDQCWFRPAWQNAWLVGAWSLNGSSLGTFDGPLPYESNAGIGVFANASGLSYTGFITGATCVQMYLQKDGNTSASFTYTLSGTNIGTFTNSPPGTISTRNAITVSLCAAVASNQNAGVNTNVISTTSSGNPVFLSRYGGFNLVDTNTMLTKVYVLSAHHATPSYLARKGLPSDLNATIDLLNSHTSNDVNTVNSYAPGRVIWVDVSTGFNETNMTQDGLHFNNLGNAFVASNLNAKITIYGPAGQ